MRVLLKLESLMTRVRLKVMTCYANKNSMPWDNTLIAYFYQGDLEIW